VVLLGWLVCFALIATILFAFYPKAQVGANPITVTEEAFYWTFGRVAWPLALCWIVFACVNGYGGPINGFLSCPLWQPLAKLSFCMYIWHSFMECVNAGGLRTDTYFSNYSLVNIHAFIQNSTLFLNLFTFTFSSCNFGVITDGRYFYLFLCIWPLKLL